jgi:hypothetical protein
MERGFSRMRQIFADIWSQPSLMQDFNTENTERSGGPRRRRMSRVSKRRCLGAVIGGLLLQFEASPGSARLRSENQVRRSE